MEHMDLPAWAQVGISGLALASLVYVFMGMRSLFREFMTWMGNHMSHNTQAMVDVARSMEKLANAVDDALDKIDEKLPNEPVQ